MNNVDYNLLNTFQKYALLDYQIYAQNPEKYPLPILKKFENEDKKIWYFGANHSWDYQDEMFKQIEKSFEFLQPELVILEGSLKINSLNDDYIQQLLSKTRNEIITEKGEYGLGLLLALQKNIKVFCPEPSFLQQVEFLEKEFRLNEIFVSFVIEMADQYSKLVDETRSLQQYLQEEIDWQKETLKVLENWQNFDFSYANFLTCFKQITTLDFDQTKSEFWEELVDPIPWETKNYKWNILNDIAKTNCDFRDQFILSQISQKTQIYNKILIIYGGSHLYVQEKALNQILK